MSRFVFSFLMAPLCGTQVLWLMNNQEPFMVLCVLQQAACAVQGRRSRSGWGWVGGCCWLISHSIETIWVTLIWGPLHTACWTVFSQHYTLHTARYIHWTLHSAHHTFHTAHRTVIVTLAQGKFKLALNIKNCKKHISQICSTYSIKYVCVSQQCTVYIVHFYFACVH